MHTASTTTTLDRPLDDPYPSRTGSPPEFLPRIDPVVHGGAADGPLDRAQLAAFERDGFVVVERAFDRAEVAALDDALTRSLAAADRTDPRVIVEPGSDDVRSIFAFHRDAGPLADVLHDERIAGVARQLTGGAVSVHQSRINAKPAFRGKEFQWHSDFETWHTEDGMPRMRCVSASLWLTDNHSWNGPLLVMPGSHRWFVTCTEPTPESNHERSLQAQEIGVPDDESLTELYGRCGIEPVTGPAGSVLFFDCNLMHASPSNISPEPRRNLFAVCNSVHNELEEPFSAPGVRPDHIASRPAEVLGDRF